MNRTLRNIATLTTFLVLIAGTASAQLAEKDGSSVELVKEQPAVSQVETNSVKSAPVVEPAAPAPIGKQPESIQAVQPAVSRPAVRRARASWRSPARSTGTVTRIREVELQPAAPAQTKTVLSEAAPLAVPASAVAKTAPPAASGHVDRIVEFARTKEQTAKQKPAGNPVKMGLSVIVKLAVVLALAYVTILALKLLSTKRDLTPRGRQDLKVVDTIKLSQTSSLHVVDFNGRKILVGSAAGQVSLLREDGRHISRDRAFSGTGRGKCAG